MLSFLRVQLYSIWYYHLWTILQIYTLLIRFPLWINNMQFNHSCQLLFKKQRKWIINMPMRGVVQSDLISHKFCNNIFNLHNPKDQWIVRSHLNLPKVWMYLFERRMYYQILLADSLCSFFIYLKTYAEIMIIDFTILF